MREVPFCGSDVERKDSEASRGEAVDGRFEK